MYAKRSCEEGRTSNHQPSWSSPQAWHRLYRHCSHKNVRAVGVVREVSFLDSCLCLRFLIDESEREHDICSLSERRLHAFFIGFRNLLHKIPPLLSCVNEIELTISIMGRVSVSIDPIGFCTSVTRIHLYGFLTSCNRVDECHIHEEVVENTQYATPLFSGEPRPFKTINLVLVSTHTLTHHSTVGISTSVHNRGDNGLYPLAFGGGNSYPLIAK